MKPKKNPKVDVSKRRVLFLQIGLILMLLISYFAIEMKMYSVELKENVQIEVTDPDEEVIPITVVNTPPPPKLPPLPTVIEPIPNDSKEPEDIIPSSEPTDIVEIENIVEAKTEETIEPVPFSVIENVPVYPGCEGLSSNEERKKCMSDKISGFINKNFDKGLGENLGLNGINRVNIIFQIDTKGNIINVQSRAPHPKLEQEANRVINALPQMQPGKQRGNPVPVSYSLPIIFKIDN